ncbi:MAG: PASTA domain-containing protein, partial [Firmicutes bacterium]|nr:PASTA domain-containing protein [Bacillota bacterium]
IMREIMEYEVNYGSGSNAKMDGYRIGGKTGTAQKAENGGYSKYDYYSSFVCMAPMDDPKLTLLVIVDSPRGATYASVVAVPAAKEILRNVLRYMGVSAETDSSGNTQTEMATVPDVTGMSYENAYNLLKEYGFRVAVGDGKKGDGKWKVIDQYPKSGKKAAKKSTVYLYKG